MTRADFGLRRLSCHVLARLGGEVLEGPCWDAEAGRLLFVDITAGTVFVLHWQSQRVESVSLGEPVSAIIPRRSGGEIIACQRGIATSERGGVRLALPLERDHPSLRTNDAKCDPKGRLWVGTMSDDETPGAGSLYRLSADWSWVKVLESVTISNGLGWSPDGDTMYYIDSPTRRVDCFDYDLSTGEATARRSLLDTAKFAGLPDGMSVDVEGCLWVAFYGGAAVRRFSPAGELLAVVDVPTANVTSCAFTGPRLDHLVITTARAPDAGTDETGGHVYVTDPGVRGLPIAEFAG